MGYTIGQVRRWDAGHLATAGTEVLERRTRAETARTGLVDGRAQLAEGWSGVAADAVLDAADGEKTHVTKLSDALEDLADALVNADAALGPAVQALRDRLDDAGAAGLVAGEDSVGPAPGRDDISQDVVDDHVEAIGRALLTVQSLDEHYGRLIDAIASRLHHAIPSEVDRRPIPGADDPWPGVGVTAATGAAERGLPNYADDLDPETRGKHARNPAPDDFGRNSARGLRGLGRLAGPLGAAVTVHDGLSGYAAGETTAGEAFFETGGALGGGAAGGFVAGASAGAALGPAGAIVGAGIGAAVGSWAGQAAVDAILDEFAGDDSGGN